MVRLFALMSCCACIAQQRNPAVWSVHCRRSPIFSTPLKELVSSESGSNDPAGQSRIADLLAVRLRGLGGEVRLVAAPADMVRFQNTPSELGRSVVAQFRGSGTKTILLLAHMATVYRPGMLGQQPFRIEGDRAYGLGIADNKRVSHSSFTRCRWSNPCRRGLV